MSEIDGEPRHGAARPNVSSASCGACRRRAPFVLAALLVAAGTASAQVAGSSSESHVETARNVSAGGGEATSTNFVAESEVAPNAAGEVVQSSSYRFAGTAVWTDGAFVVGNDVPIVYGVAGGHGDHDGGEAEQVFGFNFDVPGGASPIVRFAGASGTGTTLVGNTVISSVSPAGNDAFGNPKALVDVAVENLAGVSQRLGSYVFTPAVTTQAAPKIGEPWRFDYIAEPASLYGFALGKSVNGFAVPVPPIDGSLELIFNVVQLLGATFTPSGYASFTLYLPDDPALIGFPIEIQAVALETLFPTLTGAWSNRLVAVIE